MNQSAVASTIKIVHVSGNRLGNDLTFAFANNASANTQVVKTVSKPTWANKNYKLLVFNPSTVTDLTLKLFDAEDIGDSYITSVIVPKKQTITGTEISAYSVIVEGMFTSNSIKIVVSNDTALGAAEGFTATIRIREV